MKDKEKQTVGVSLRMSEELLERVDACIKKLEQQNPGLSVSRSNAILMLLARGLDQFEGSKARTKETRL